MATRELLRSTRRFHGISQAALAWAVGVCQLTVSRWETGKATPTKEQAELVGKILQTDPKVLFAGLDQ